MKSTNNYEKIEITFICEETGIKVKTEIGTMDFYIESPVTIVVSIGCECCGKTHNIYL